MRFVSKKGITRTGTKANIFDAELCNRIRKRLNLTKKELTDRQIRDVTRLSNTEIGNFIIDNPEGFMMEVGFSSKYPMGVLSVSKHLPKEFREDKEEKIELIKSIDIDERVRKTFLKRYDLDIGHSINYRMLKELGERVPHLNLSTFFYKFKIMWFNKKNVKSKKGESYIFKPNHNLNKQLLASILSGKDYYEWNFHDFYRHKVKSEF